MKRNWRTARKVVGIYLAIALVGAAAVAVMELGLFSDRADEARLTYEREWNAADGALLEFVAAGMSVEASGIPLRSALDGAATSFGRSVERLGTLAPPDALLTNHRLVLPAYQGLATQMRAIATAAADDAFRFEREWHLLTLSLYELQVLEAQIADLALALNEADDPGFHAELAQQSAYPILAPGETAKLVVAYRNTGPRGWYRDRASERAVLATSEERGYPELAYRWPRLDRPALLTTDFVGPGQIGWFEFTIRAPRTPGTYQLDVRPLIEDVTWLEDYGVYWLITVQ